MNISPARAKLAAVLGMLGSAHEGEALAAARMAERMRLELGLSWAELLSERPRRRRRRRGRVRVGPDGELRGTAA